MYCLKLDNIGMLQFSQQGNLSYCCHRYPIPLLEAIPIFETMLSPHSLQVSYAVLQNASLSSDALILTSFAPPLASKDLFGFYRRFTEPGSIVLKPLKAMLGGSLRTSYKSICQSIFCTVFNG